MSARRHDLMDAAESLIRLSHSTDFTMLAVAEMGGVSPTTPYNLFDSKAGLLYALMNRSMDGVDVVGLAARDTVDPYERALRCARAVAAFFTSDPGFYRVLYQFLLGVDDPVHRPAFMNRGHDYWKAAVQGLADAGHLPAELSQDELALEMEIHFLGVLDLWVHGEVDDAEFEARAVRGVALLLLGLAQDEARARLQRHLRNTRRHLPASFSFSARYPAATTPKSRASNKTPGKKAVRVSPPAKRPRKRRSQTS